MRGVGAVPVRVGPEAYRLTAASRPSPMGSSATFKRSSSRFASGGVSVRSGSAGATARSSADDASSWARQQETWILLELCNAGSLQVRGC